MKNLKYKLLSILSVFLLIILLTLSTIIYLSKNSILNENNKLIKNINKYDDMETFKENSSLLIKKLQELSTNKDYLELEYNTLNSDIENINNEINDLTNKIKKISN